MFAGIRVENGQIQLDGYPPGSSFHGITGPKAQELCRMLIFHGDLKQVREWLAAADSVGLQSPMHEPLCSAALVKFCSCFDGTAGLRKMPLRKKGVFSPDDRRSFEALKSIRNKMVAHDEHLYPGEFPGVILDSEARAIEALAVKLSAPFSVMPLVEDLKRLTEIALVWTFAEFNMIATEIVADTNALPIAERQQRLKDMVPFTIKIGPEENRF